MNRLQTSVLTLPRIQRPPTRRRGALLTAAVAAMLAPAASRAASVTFQNSVVVTSAANLDVPTTAYPGAVLVQAVNFGNAAPTVLTPGGQTIAFANGTENGAAASGTATAIFRAGSENNNALFSGDTGNADLNTVLRTQAWANSGNMAAPETLRIGGLTTGTSYVAQLLASDMRAGSAGRSQRYNDVEAYTGNQSDSFSVQMPTYVLAKFTADATGYQDVFIEDTRAAHPPWDTTFAGFTLYQIPEPASGGLLAFGALAALVRRRCRC